MDGREAMSFIDSHPHYYLQREASMNLSPARIASGLHAPLGMRPCQTLMFITLWITIRDLISLWLAYTLIFNTSSTWGWLRLRWCSCRLCHYRLHQWRRRWLRRNVVVVGRGSERHVSYEFFLCLFLLGPNQNWLTCKYESLWTHKRKLTKLIKKGHMSLCGDTI